MRKMKGLLAGLLAVALAFACVPVEGLVAEAAEDVTSDGFRYKTEYGEVTVTGYTGPGGDIAIPSKIGQFPVTAIDHWAFKDCSNLTGITIPDSVTTLGAQAFEGCSGLTGIIIPASVISIQQERVGIGAPSTLYNGLFSGCSNLTTVKVDPANQKYDSREGCNAVVDKETSQLVAGCNNTVIPASVTGIGDMAFRNCEKLTNITIPNGVASIGAYAFMGCSSLKEIRIPDGVTSLSSDAFSGCSSLKEIRIPDSVTTLGTSVFSDCSSLENITMSNNTEYIGANAFSGCSSLTSIKIPASVTEFGVYMAAWRHCLFSGCSNLTTIEVDPANPKFDSRGNCNAIIDTENNALLFGCKNTRIPDDVTSISEDAFYGTGLIEITILPQVTSIGSKAFTGCHENLTIYGFSGTEAERYAAEMDIAFVALTGMNDICWAAVTLGQDSYKYDGSAKTPAVTVTMYGEPLTPGTDYTISYEKNINAGVASVILTGQGEYTGTKEKAFTITPADISAAEVTLDKSTYMYDGAAKTPAITVTVDKRRLAPNTDYKAAYSNNINVGTAKVTITGIGNYSGSREQAFTIAPQQPQPKPQGKVICKKTTYNVAYGAKPFKIQASSDSSLTYQSSAPKVASVDKTGKVSIKKTGVAVITVKTASDSVKVTVKIAPKKQGIKSVKAVSGKKLAVKWAKDKMATGYQVQLSTSKNFKKIAKKQNVSKNTCTFKKLKTGKKYYVRLRAYKVSGKNTLYGAWSNVKQSGKIKK